MIQVQILQYMWAALGLYWLFRARNTAKATSHEDSLLRWSRLALLAFAVLLLFSPWLRMGLLARRFVPLSNALAWFGVFVTAAAIALCIWSRSHLGANWSDKVVLKADHQLIRTGPYKHLRHPIYSGVLLGILGTALTIGEWRGLLSLVIMTINYCIKARREERILTTQFGDAYRDYSKSAGFPLPKF
jgi:protein-S-isoprenylcysteine O-methyltransferase Ste14